MTSTQRESRRQFVSEPIDPICTPFSPRIMATGQPSPPNRFRWRGVEYRIRRVLDVWKTSGPDRGGGKERYVRKHGFRIETTDGTIMSVYFERQPRSRGRAPRWWLATIEERGSGPDLESRAS